MKSSKMPIEYSSTKYSSTSEFRLGSIQCEDYQFIDSFKHIGKVSSKTLRNHDLSCILKDKKIDVNQTELRIKNLLSRDPLVVGLERIDIHDSNFAEIKIKRNYSKHKEMRELDSHIRFIGPPINALHPVETQLISLYGERLKPLAGT